MRSSMLGVIAERRQHLAAAAGSDGAGAAGGAAEAEAADLLDMLLQATDDNGVPMTGAPRFAPAPHFLAPPTHPHPPVSRLS